jgi:uncharacterized protein (TIGR00725 family)
LENLNRNIAFLGFSESKETDSEYRAAYETGRLLAESGYTVVDGGGLGVMEAASLGAKAGGGKTVGVTFYPKNIANFEGRTMTNPLDKEVVTRNYLERTLTLLAWGHMYIFFKGGTGTISEFGMAWGLARLYFGHHKPLILYGDFWNNVIEAFQENMRLRPEEMDVYKVVNSPEKALAAIKGFEEKFGANNHMHVKVTSEAAFEY